MTPEQARHKFADLAKSDGIATAAARLQCSTTQVQYVIDGKRNPGMRLARNIEAIYGIVMQDWMEPPKTEILKRIA